MRDRATSHAASGLTTTDEEPVSSINRIGRLRHVADFVELLTTVGCEFTSLDELGELLVVSDDAEKVHDSTVQIIEYFDFAVSLFQQNVGHATEGFNVDSVVWYLFDDPFGQVIFSSDPCDGRFRTLWGKPGD